MLRAPLLYFFSIPIHRSEYYPNPMETLSLLPQQRIDSISLRSEKPTRAVERRASKVARETVRSLLEADLESVHRLVRESLDLKRREISHVLEDDTGILTTPLFEYSVRLKTDVEDREEWVWMREVLFADPEGALKNRALLKVFADEFDSISVRFSESLEIEDWIDRVEEQNAVGVSIDYDLKCSWCELWSESGATLLRLEGRELHIGRKPGSDATLEDMAQWVTSKTT